MPLFPHPSLRRFLWPLLLLVPAGLLLWRAEPPDRYERAVAAAQRAFADGDYRKAQFGFAEAEAVRPGDRSARLGEALALLQLREFSAAEALLGPLTVTGSPVEKSFALANRGILYDRTGRYQDALADYSAALELNPGLADGPGLMTRFLRNQAEKPPTIADRARYLRAELAKPPQEQQLSLPAVDARQRPYAP